MKTMMIAASAALVGASALAGTVTVYSNNAGGDAFTNPGGVNTGQAVGASGWHYNNVRGSGVVGVSSAYARSGNGSVSFNGASGASKADIEFFGSAVANGAGNFGPTSALGTLGSLTSLSYDWYRDSASTNPATQTPVIRLLLSNAAGSQFGYIVFEEVYNGNDLTTDQWHTVDVLGGNSRMWATGTLPNVGLSEYSETYRIDNWMSTYADLLVVGVSLGVGSGWAGEFFGAIDNVTFGFNGVDTTYNFEVAGQVIPAPLAGAMGGVGLMLVGARRRR